ncbi:MAG: UDP-N-acetylmuramate dehydrogenase [Candidatus Pacebacteria bacterium]|nr:UDP-N-acetylmuramate dehydrogenase [Candidatus Paceibacterota bacterium]
MKDIVFEKNVSLKEYTTFKVGGPAKYFFAAKNKDELASALQLAKEKKLDVFVFGGGSNLLMSDKGFKGLVVKIEISGMEFSDSKAVVGGGVCLSKFANAVGKNGFTGFEWAIGIPQATVGGAVYGNAQAFGFRISDNIELVEVFDRKTFKLKTFSKEQCKFTLKNSAFKKNKNLIVISVVFNLQKGNEAEIKENVAKFLKHRKQSHPLNFPSAGSVFVNPEKKGQVTPAGFLIEKAGLKGKKIGNAQISEKHANFIINLGGAKAKDVLALIRLAQKKVKENSKINLETEIQQIGF